VAIRVISLKLCRIRIHATWLEAFFAAAEARIAAAQRRGRKGALQAWRDQALFKVCFGWGLRRAELAMLDVCDFRGAAKLPEFGVYGQVHVRYGKAKRGGGPQRRTVLTVFRWAAEVVEQYLTDVRPSFGCPDHPAMFVTERGTRISVSYINERFAEIRAEAHLPEQLTPHVTLRTSSKARTGSKDNRSANWTPGIRAFADASSIELVPSPTYASYPNRIECHVLPPASSSSRTPTAAR